jgi:hypothetical protein
MRQIWWAILMMISVPLFLLGISVTTDSIWYLWWQTIQTTVAGVFHNSEDIFSNCSYYPEVKIEWQSGNIALTNQGCSYSGDIKIWQKIKIKYDSDKLNWLEISNIYTDILTRLFFAILFWYLTYVWYEMTRKEKQSISNNPQL